MEPDKLLKNKKTMKFTQMSDKSLLEIAYCCNQRLGSISKPKKSASAKDYIDFVCAVEELKKRNYLIKGIHKLTFSK